jgi:Zn-dependent peptidase ImmA (M78 family)/DNA-binding XRE family transcriptional regulator
MNTLPNTNPVLVGQRLLEARKAAGLTQDEAAKAIGCSRPIFIAIEKGTRPASSEEIVKLARRYGRNIHEIVQPRETVGDLQPHFRTAISRSGIRSGNDDLEKAADILKNFAQNYRMLDEISRQPSIRNYPPEVDLDKYRGSIYRLAEDIANRERSRLGVGDKPLYALRDTLEYDVGLKTMYYKLPSKIAGMYCNVSEFGFCIMVNICHPQVRRTFTLAHEYAHFIVDRYRPGIDRLDNDGNKPLNEKFADSFAQAFLMPSSNVTHKFNEIVTASNDFQIADLCRMAHYFNVSIVAMGLRLEWLDLLHRGTIYDKIVESHFKKGEAYKQLKLEERQDDNERFPKRYRQLAVDAYEKGELSEGQLVKIFASDPVRTREIVQQLANRSSLEDPAFRLRPLNMGATLLTRGG